MDNDLFQNVLRATSSIRHYSNEHPTEQQSYSFPPFGICCVADLSVQVFYFANVETE